MWFRIVYTCINTVLFVCFVNAQIPDSSLFTKHEDTVFNLFDLLVRLVNCGTNNGAEQQVQVRLTGNWYTVCNESYLHIDDDKICHRARSSYTINAPDIGETFADTGSSSRLFAKLHCKSGMLCAPEITTNCPGGGVHLMKICPSKSGAVGGFYYPLSACSYPGHTVANCSGHDNLWMTYEHVFFHERLPQAFIAWTSSYLKRTPCDRIDTGRCFNNSIEIYSTSSVACVNVCLHKVSTDLNTSLDAATFENHTNICSCFTTPRVCSGEENHCTGDLYEVTTSKRNHAGQGSSLSDFCIAVQRSNGTSLFTARPCINLLPQLCGTHMCFPQSYCVNNSPCEITKDYLNYTCKCRDGFSGRHCIETVVTLPDAAFSTTSFKPASSLQETFAMGIVYITIALVLTAITCISVVAICVIPWKKRKRSRHGSIEQTENVNTNAAGNILLELAESMPAEPRQDYDDADYESIGEVPQQGDDGYEHAYSGFDRSRDGASNEHAYTDMHYETHQESVLGYEYMYPWLNRQGEGASDGSASNPSNVQSQRKAPTTEYLNIPSGI